MKKIIFFVLIIFLIGCKKDEPEKTTYQITNNITPVDTTQTEEYLDGTLWEIVVFCYNGDDIIRQDNLPFIKPDGHKSAITEVTDNITKVKVSFKYLPHESPNYDLSINFRRYVVAFCFIEKEKNNSIVIDDNTMLSGSLKSTFGNTFSEQINEQLMRYHPFIQIFLKRYKGLNDLFLLT